MNRTLLIGSLMLNCVLAIAAAIVFLDRGEGASAQQKLGASQVPSVAARSVNSGGSSDSSCEAASYEYWRPAYVAEAKLRLASESSSACAYNELAARYPFLPQEKLEQIEQLKASADRKRANAHAANDPGAIEAEVHRATEEGIARILTRAELLEYELRESILAQRLLATGFPFSEQEFRAVYAALNGKQGEAHPHPASGGLTLDSKEVRGALAKERYELLLRHQDPAYRALRRFAAEKNLPQERVEDAYNVISECAARIKAEGLSFGLIGTKGEERVAQLVAARDKQLKEIVGEDATASLSSLLNTIATRNIVRLHNKG